MGKPYRRCNYDVKVVINPADVNFELWFDGAKLSKDHPVPVQWQASAAPPLVNLMDGELPAITHARRVGVQREGRPVEDPTARVQSMRNGQGPPNYYSPNGKVYQ